MQRANKTESKRRISIKIKETETGEAGRRHSDTSSLRHPHQAKSSFLDSFQGMFHSFDSLGSEENKQIRPLYSELLSAAKKNTDSQRRAREGKSWTLAYEDKNYGGQREDTELTSPLLVYTGNKDCSFPVKRKAFQGEMDAFESAAQAVSIRVNEANNFDLTLEKQYQKQENETQESAEKRRKGDSLENYHTNNGPRERESYWERRKKNNASAKKSRDARKTRELQTQIKAAFLERENVRIHAQLMIVQQENACLKRVLCAKM